MARNLYWLTFLEIYAFSNLRMKVMDFGNLVLYDDNELGEYLWQSFIHLTDTFLTHKLVFEYVGGQE